MAMTLITTNTSSNAASSSFTSSIDSTYKLFIFKFFDVNPATDAAYFQFQGSTDTGSSYGVTKTTTWLGYQHGEAGDSAQLVYEVEQDLAQATTAQMLSRQTGNESDECCAGTLWLFNPSNTTYVKHFYATTNNLYHTPYFLGGRIGGYFNTTSAIDAMQFTMSTGNMDAVIKMYGVG